MARKSTTKAVNEEAEKKEEQQPTPETQQESVQGPSNEAETPTDENSEGTVKAPEENSEENPEENPGKGSEGEAKSQAQITGEQFSSMMEALVEAKKIVPGDNITKKVSDSLEPLDEETLTPEIIIDTLNEAGLAAFADAFKRVCNGEDVSLVASEFVVPDPKKPASKTQKVAKEPVDKAEQERIDGILKMYSQYAELYIDSKGGVFTANTPESVRGNAKLYTNKYHK